MTVEQFIVGVDSIPSWFTEEVQKGKAHIQYEENSKVIKQIVINTPFKRYTAYRGDVVLMLQKGMTVIPKEIAKKYGQQPIKS